MKFLRWLLYIVVVLLALLLVVPLFLPSTVEVSAEKEVAVFPGQVFQNAATFTDRNAWDPWLATEPDAEYSIETKPGYVGSTYAWNGKKIKTGITNYLCGIPVATPGKNSGEIKARTYGKIPVIQAMHTGPYEEFVHSYNALIAMPVK
jgi:hypothetical protein